jgi:two-component system nitrate/nitrite response regulator NarL
MIRVLVVEEVRAVCEIIAKVLRSEDDLEVVGCATDIDEAVVHLANCDVAVINASLTTDTSRRLVHSLRRLAPRLKVVVMGLARNQQAIMQCAEAGVAGYVLKDSSLDDLLQTIRATNRNDALVAPPLASTLASYVADLMGLDTVAADDPCGPQSLTRREREVLTLVQEGLTNQEIAETLVIELGTVKNHVHNILRKLNVNSRRDAVHASRLAGVWGTGLMSARPLHKPAPLQRELNTERTSLFSPALGATN